MSQPGSQIRYQPFYPEYRPGQREGEVTPPRHEQPRGIGSSPSSVEASPGGNSNISIPPEMEEQVIEYRFCSIFDSCLPEWIVDYLEEICLSVYNYFAPLFGAGRMSALQIGDENDALESRNKGLKTVAQPRVYQAPQSLRAAEPSAPPASNPTQGVVLFKTTFSEFGKGYLLTGHGRLFQLTEELIRRQENWLPGDTLEFERDELTASNSTLCCTNKRTNAVWRALPVLSFDSPEKPGKQEIPR